MENPVSSYDMVSVELPISVLLSLMQSMVPVAQAGRDVFHIDLDSENPEVSSAHVPLVFTSYMMVQMEKMGVLKEGTSEHYEAPKIVKAFEDWMEMHRILTSISPNSDQ